MSARVPPGRFVIYGAGGIGGSIGARMHLAGLPVALIARGSHLKALQSDGMRFVTPTEVHQLHIPAYPDPAAVNLNASDVVMLTMKSQHTQTALEALSMSMPSETAVACVQNGVCNETLALRFFPNVYATLVSLPAMHMEPGEVITFSEAPGGVLDTGGYPGRVDANAELIAANLELAGFSAIPDARIMAKKYAKLLDNTTNALQAATGMAEGARAIAKTIRREALACYKAAGIDCQNAEDTKTLKRRYRFDSVPGYEHAGGSSWQSIARGTGNIETEYLNGEISWLGRMHGVPTPANDVMVDLARELVRDASAPGSVSVERVLALIDTENRKA